MQYQFLLRLFVYSLSLLHLLNYFFGSPFIIDFWSNPVSINKLETTSSPFVVSIMYPLKAYNNISALQ